MEIIAEINNKAIVTIMGVPGKVVSEVSPELEEHLKWGTEVYHTLPKRCHDTLKEINKIYYTKENMI